MKKTLNMLMALGLVAVLTACGGNSGTNSDENQTTPTEATETTTGTNTTNFVFENRTNAELDTFYITNTVTIIGITEAITVKTNNGTLIVNGVDTDVAEYSVNAGDTVAVRVRSSGSYSTTITTRVQAQGLEDFFAITTKADTPTPPVVTPISTPTISMANQTVNDDGGGFANPVGTPIVTGVNAGAVYSLTANPYGANLTINSSTGAMTWQGDLFSDTTETIGVKVLNTDGGTDTTTFSLTVIDNG